MISLGENENNPVFSPKISLFSNGTKYLVLDIPPIHGLFRLYHMDLSGSIGQARARARANRESHSLPAA